MLSILSWIWNPEFWLMNEEYIEDWNKFIIEDFLNKEDVIHVDSLYLRLVTDLNLKTQLSVSINGRQVWLGNYPYAYGTHNNRRPSRKNIIRLRKYVKNYHKIHPEDFI